jgi:single-strand DNA-binding protein
MAVGETMLTVVGNVASELTHRVVGNGAELVSFWLRSNERRFDREAQKWVDGRFFALRVTCWRKLASATHASLSKGDPVIVSGRVQTSEYEVEGERRSMPELEAYAIGPNLNWCTALVRRTPRAASADDAGAATGPPPVAVTGTAAEEPLAGSEVGVREKTVSAAGERVVAA